MSKWKFWQRKRAGVRVVSREEIEEGGIDAIVVMRKSMLSPPIFSDNVEGECSVCHEVVSYRPYVPSHLAPIVCVICAIEQEGSLDAILAQSVVEQDAVTEIVNLDMKKEK